MTTSSFSFRQLRRPLFVLLGLLSLAIGVAFTTPSTQTANAQSSPIGECLGAPFCTVLHVKLDPAVKYATVVATRVEKTGKDDDIMLQYDYEDGSNSYKNIYTSGDVIAGSGPGGANCKVAPTPDAGYFDITVRGVATGTLKKVNMCANESPKAGGDAFETDSGQKAKVKTVTVNVVTPEEQGKMGGIAGKYTVTDSDGKKQNCTTAGIDITNNAGGDAVHPDMSGSGFDTGYTLKPGRYKVYINCIVGTGGNQRSYPKTFNNIEVVAGKITKLDDTSCSTTSSNGSCDTPDNAAEDPVEKNLCPIKNWAFAWAACPLISGLMGFDDDDPSAGGVIGQFQDWIVTAMIINTDEVFGKDDGTTSGRSTAYYKAWNSFRIIAISILIIAGIVMVVSQAFGLGIFDAYTIRKFLPRILIIAIFITLSWPVMRYVVQLLDNLTVWIASILAAPFNDIAPEPFSAGALIAQWLAILGAVALVNPVILISYVGTIVTALAITALAIAVRKLIMIFIIVSITFWLVLLLFKGTEGAGKTALKTFWLLGIAGIGANALITMGSIGAQMSTSDGDPLRLLPMGFLIGSTFGVPALMFQIMSGAGPTGKIFGGLNDRGRGIFDRLKNTRTEQRAGIIDSMKKGERFSERNKFTSAFNKASRGIYNAPKAGFNPAAWNRRMSAGLDQADRQAANAILEALQKAGLDQDDSVLKMAQYDSAKVGIQKFVADARDSVNQKRDDGKFATDSEYNAAMAKATKEALMEGQRAAGAIEAADLRFGTRGLKIAAGMQRVNTGTGYDNQKDLVETLADAAGGNASTAAALAGFANAATKRAGRFDLAPGFGTLNNLVQQQLRYTQGMAAKISDEQYVNSGVTAAMGASNTDIARTKTKGVENIAKDLSSAIRMHNNVLSSTTASAEQKNESRVRLAELTAKLSNAQQTTSMYGAETNTLALHDQGHAPIRTVISQVNNQTSPTQTTVDQRQFITVQHPTDPTRTYQVPNPQYNRPTQSPNPNYDPVMADRAQVLSQSRGRNQFEDQNLRNPGD